MAFKTSNTRQQFTHTVTTHRVRVCSPPVARCQPICMETTLACGSDYIFPWPKFCFLFYFLMWVSIIQVKLRLLIIRGLIFFFVFFYII